MSRFYGTKWHALEEPSPLAGFGRFHPVIEKILISRGVTDPEDMAEFLSDRPLLTHDPYRMKGMEEAVARITQAIRNGEKIVFYGDYDVDGITSVALFIDFFFSLTPHIEFYIPLRQEEGYGLNREALKEIREEYQADLVVTADCGISAIEEINFAREIGLDLIVTDHHSPGNELPDAIILNPKQAGCGYPFKELSGCGVAFKLIQAFQKHLDLPKSRVTDQLDLVAMATVCDVVPLRDENRTLLKYGLQKFRQTRRVGLQALLKKLSLQGSQIGVRELGFVVGPHFNASGRIDDARSGVQLLVTQDGQTAERIAAHLQKLNLQRKAIQEEGLEICHELVNAKHGSDPFLIVESQDLHEGVIGIIAGRLRDAYYRPTIVMTPSQEPGVFTGSGRSVDGFHLFEELRPASSLMERFGGHANACGLKIRKENIPMLRNHLFERVLTSEERNPDLLKKKICVVADLEPEDLTESLLSGIQALEPFGMGNEKPYFRMKEIATDQNSRIRYMGSEGQHMKVTHFRQASKPETNGLEILGFGVDESTREMICSQNRFDLVFFPQINEFRGKRSIQLMIRDLKMTGWE